MAIEPTRDRVECDWSASSDAGCERAHNEDAWRVAPQARVFALADGMGGYNAGDVAAHLAVDRLIEGLGHRPADGEDRAHLLQRQIDAANAAILGAAARRPECLGMATTLAALWIDENDLLMAHVGHSRVYLLRGTRCHLLTRDHVVRATTQAGAALSRVLGIEQHVDAEIRRIDWFHGDRLLICSDGLHRSVSESSIADSLLAADRASACVDGLVAAALAAGCQDNVTAIAIFLSRSFTTI